jgi:cytochrome P450
MPTPSKFDPYDDQVFKRGAEAFAECGTQRLIEHYQGRFDFYISSDYDDIKKGILSDAKVWDYEAGSGPKPLAPDLSGIGIMTNPPRHFGIRHVIQRGFSPKHLKRLAVDVDELIHELISAMLAMPKQQGNLFELFAMPLAARLMCRMIGVPEDEYLFYKKSADQFMYKIFNATEVGAEGPDSYKMAQGFMPIMAERRKALEDAGVEPSLEHVGTLIPDDFISRYLCDTVDGEPLSEWDIISMLSAIVAGGNETTMNLITNMLWRLLEVPERWEQLKAQPELIPAAIEESLRFDPPVIGMFRGAAVDTQLQGMNIPKGARVMYNMAAANREESIWENPNEFRLDRSMTDLRKHTSFSGGHTMCLGAALARMEVKQVFEALVNRLPNLRLTGSPSRAPGFNFNGQMNLPVAWG